MGVLEQLVEAFLGGGGPRRTPGGRAEGRLSLQPDDGALKEWVPFEVMRDAGQLVLMIMREELIDRVR